MFAFLVVSVVVIFSSNCVWHADLYCLLCDRSDIFREDRDISSKDLPLFAVVTDRVFCVCVRSVWREACILRSFANALCGQNRLTSCLVCRAFALYVILLQATYAVASDLCIQNMV